MMPTDYTPCDDCDGVWSTSRRVPTLTRAAAVRTANWWAQAVRGVAMVGRSSTRQMPCPV